MLRYKGLWDLAALAEMLKDIRRGKKIEYRVVWMEGADLEDVDYSRD